MTSHFIRVQRVGQKKVSCVGADAARVAAKHNLRTIQAELGCESHINSSRTHLNQILHGGLTPDQVAAAWAHVTLSRGIQRPRSNACSLLEVVCSLPLRLTVDVDAYFRDCLEWIAQRFGGLDFIVSAVVHHDEAQPHMHVLLIPLVAVPGLGWRLKGDAVAGNRAAIKELQDAFFGEVASRYGLTRAGPSRGQAKAKAAAAVLALMRRGGHPALRDALWPQIRASIEDDPAPFASALGIELPTPKAKPMRSSTAIFISSGRGPRTERQAKNRWTAM